MARTAVDHVVEKTGRTPEQALAGILKDLPLGRLVRPEEVAAAVLYLCSPDAAAVTGTTLAVAGGECDDAKRSFLRLERGGAVSPPPA